MTQLLWTPFALGPISLQNRVVMAPLTRGRAPGNVPNASMAKYYAARAAAGLIITEGTAPSANGLGYARIPGCYSQDQIHGWRQVTSAVHQAGGRIFLQIMHCGRICQVDNMPTGSEVLAPSAIWAKGELYTDAYGNQPHSQPREMSEEDILSTIQEFVHCAKSAISAGFDGVELHSANGYLLEQFINPNSNRRQDRWGGSIENRLRFPLEVAKAVAAAIGPERVGVRVSPYGVYNDMAPYAEVDTTYDLYAKALAGLKLAYLHLVDHQAMGAPEVPQRIRQILRASFPNSFILSGNYDAARAENDLRENRGELVAFGRPFISNADLVAKLKSGRALTAPDYSTFYTAGDKGYNDYPAS